MTADANPRLYYPPNHTIETLRAVVSGSKTTEKIADELGVSENTAQNKIHDPLHLGLIEEDNGKYEPTKDAKRVVQLDDESAMEETFLELPGVEQVLEEIENGGATTEKVGRIISFETDSGAAKESTFKNYGRVYANWIERLDLGEVEDSTSGSQHPLKTDNGANNPRVPPQKVIDALRVIDDVESHEDLADRLGYSDRHTKKILSTAYALEVAERERGGGFSTTEIGRTVTTTSEGKQREVLRNSLLEIPLVQAYCNRVPSGKFRNKAVMQQVSEDYSLGWSEGTVQTRAKRLYRWLLFTRLAEEESQGVLVATDKMPRGNLPDP